MNFSLDNVKKNVKSLTALFFGLFHWIFLAMPYAVVFVSFGDYREDIGFSGYKTMGETFTDADAGGLVAFFQILNIIVVSVMLLLALYVIVKEFFGDWIKDTLHIDLPKQFGPINAKVASFLSLLAYAAVSVLTFLSVIIVCLANSESESGLKAGVAPGAGVIIATILAVGAVVAIILIDKKYPELLATGPSKLYVCEACGEKASAGTAFCPTCGGKIIEKIRPIRVCENCGAKAKGQAAFCSTCGGKIIEKIPPTYVCSGCGAPSKAGVKFCSKCGGQIVEK